MMKLSAGGAAALACAIALGGCGSGSAKHTVSVTSTPPPAVSAGSRHLSWLVTRQALSELLSDSVVRDKLRREEIYEILQPGQQPLAGVPAALVVDFPSAAKLEQAVSRDQIPAGTYGVLYDPEAWRFTPLDEQRHPVEAATQAAKVAHAHGLHLIVAPALDLTKVLSTGSSGARWRRFLDLNLLGPMARVADIVELQSQSLERSTSTYATFVRAAISQVRAARQATRVLAGLSSNPEGAPVSSAELTSAARAVQSLVEGFWINIPRHGARCPACNPPRPDIAIKAVRATS
jgi:hypothetical protein